MTPEAPVRVLHLISALGAGGAPVMLANLALASRLGRRPETRSLVVSMTDIGQTGQRLLREGVPVASLGMRAGRPRLSAVLRLRELIRRYRPCVVQSWLYHADLLASAACWALRRGGPSGLSLGRPSRKLGPWLQQEIDARGGPRLRPALRAGPASRRLLFERLQGVAYRFRVRRRPRRG